MKITALYIDAFGNLNDFSLSDLPDRFILVMPNGGGKTTLVEFIYAVLYGLGRASGKGSARLRYLPWSGGRAGGYLDIQDSRTGHTYRVEGRFGSSPREDRLRLWDLNSGREVVLARGESPGEYLTGLSAVVFRSLVLAGEGELRTLVGGDPQGQRKRFLAGLAGDEKEPMRGSGRPPLQAIEPETAAVATDEALRQIEKRKGELRSARGKRGLIPDLEQVLQELEQNHHELAGKRQEYQSLKAARQEQEGQLKLLLERDDGAALTAADACLAGVDQAAGASGQAGRHRVDRVVGYGRRKRSGLAAFWLLISLLVSGVAGYRLLVPAGALSDMPVAIAALLLSAGFLAGGLAVWRLAAHRSGGEAVTGAEAADLPDLAGGEGPDFNARRREVGLRESIARLSGQMDLLVQAYPAIVEPDDAVAADRLRGRLGQAYREYRALELAGETLAELVQAEQADYFRPFRPRFFSHLSRLGMREIKEARLQSDFSLQLHLNRREAPTYINERELGRHEAEPVGLALRLTLAAEHVRRANISLPLVLDEPFAGWDDRRRQAAGDVLSALVDSGQTDQADQTGQVPADGGATGFGWGEATFDQGEVTFGWGGQGGEAVADCPHTAGAGTEPAAGDAATGGTCAQVICLFASKQEAEYFLAGRPGWTLFS